MSIAFCWESLTNHWAFLPSNSNILTELQHSTKFLIYSFCHTLFCDVHKLTSGRTLIQSTCMARSENVSEYCYGLTRCGLDKMADVLRPFSSVFSLMLTLLFLWYPSCFFGAQTANNQFLFLWWFGADPRVTNFVSNSICWLNGNQDDRQDPLWISNVWGINFK